MNMQARRAKQNDRIKQMFLAGMSSARIGGREGLKGGTVAVRLRRMGITRAVANRMAAKAARTARKPKAVVAE